jgi:hypothetical protein
MIKDNMTHNFLAGILSEDTIQAGEHVPPGPRAAAGETAFASAARRAGYLHLARNPVGDMLAAMLAPAMARSREEIPKAIADARTTQVYLALRCYQLEHGRLPEKLDALAPEYLKAIPLDPFTGKPFGYEPVGQKPRIWSVGPDQRTDPPDAEEGDDVVVPIEFVGP